MLTSPQVPSDMKKVIMEANRIGVDILKNVLMDFDLPNAEQLVLDLAKTVDVQKVVMASPDLQAQMAPPGAPPGGPGGPGGPGSGPNGPGGPPKGPQGQPSGPSGPPGGLSPMGGGPGGPPPGMVPAGM
jgi:hypothetical protein